MNHPPFAEGPVRPKQVLSLGLYRTGSHSLQAALEILGLKNVFHSAAIADHPEKFPFFTDACDANISSLPSYTGKVYGREEWDQYLGACEGITDLAPFAESLLDAYPEAKVILVKRDFDSWVTSYHNTLVRPSSTGFMAWMSGNVWEPILGLKVSKTVWRMYMGLLNVSRLDKVLDRQVLRAGYDRHHRRIRGLVPPERLLELDLKDLDWEPICKFLGKEIPDEPFPRRNESRVFQNKFRKVHFMTMAAGLAKVIVSAGAAGAVGAGAVWLTQRQGYLSKIW